MKATGLDFANPLRVGNQKRKNKMQDVHSDNISIKNTRRNPRVKTSNGVSYICIDETGNEIEQGMGKTIDISLGGMLLETSVAIESKYILIATIDLAGNLIETKGKVTYSRKIESEKVLTGIQFLETPQRKMKIIAEFIRIHHYRH
jgi:c-di-GMP-binding flagellar brake protein YcgR